MIKSMTGYGTASLQKEGAAVSVEIRTGNHRFFDPHVRLAREYGFLETEISQLLRDAIRRGRVDVTISLQASIPSECLISADTARAYMAAATRMGRELQLAESLDLKTLLSLPGVVLNQNSPSVEQEKAGLGMKDFVLAGVRQALGTVLQMRRQEGQALETEMAAYLRSIRDKVEAVRACMPAALQEYQQKLDERLKHLLQQVALDPQRLAQEVAILAEKTDISEEITRLESHLDQYEGMMNEGSEAGKRMDFLLQEMHREVNTVLSKTGHLEVTRLGIALKADIEKMREQVQNVE